MPWSSSLSPLVPLVVSVLYLVFICIPLLSSPVPQHCLCVVSVEAVLALPWLLMPWRALASLCSIFTSHLSWNNILSFLPFLYLPVSPFLSVFFSHRHPPIRTHAMLIRTADLFVHQNTGPIIIAIHMLFCFSGVHFVFDGYLLLQFLAHQNASHSAVFDTQHTYPLFYTLIFLPYSLQK